MSLLTIWRTMRLRLLLAYTGFVAMCVFAAYQHILEGAVKTLGPRESRPHAHPQPPRALANFRPEIAGGLKRDIVNIVNLNVPNLEGAERDGVSKRNGANAVNLNAPKWEGAQIDEMSKKDVAISPIFNVPNRNSAEMFQENETVVESVKYKYVNKFDYSLSEMPTLVETWRAHSKGMNWRPTDIMNIPRPRYLPQYKNPCYMDGELRCLPHFMVIGSPKAGSTELFDKMALHPDVVVDRKELRWFVGGRMDGQSLRHYTNEFSTLARAVQKSRNKITGDGTPIYFSDNSYWMDAPENDGFTDPTVLVPHLIHHLLPRVRLILSLRNPVDRLYSGYKAFATNNVVGEAQYTPTPEDFHERVVHSTQWLNQCFKTLPRRHCLYDFPDRNRTMFPKFYYLGIHGVTVARTRKGLYGEFLEDWLQVFPREQILIITLDELSRNKTATLNRVFAHVGLDPVNLWDLEEQEFNTIANRNTNKLPDMLDKTRDLLYDFYRPFNEKLARMMGDEKFLWAK